MGYPMERFVNSVDENLICSICCGVFTYPVVTNCGHTFCCACLNAWLRSPNSEDDNADITTNSIVDQIQSSRTRCPACRQNLEVSAPSYNQSTNGRLISSTVARPVIALRNLIESLPMKCTYAYRGCELIESVEFVENGIHKFSCAYAPVLCRGCDTLVNRSDFGVHQQMCAKNNTKLTKFKPSKSTQTAVGLLPGQTDQPCLEAMTSIAESSLMHLRTESRGARLSIGGTAVHNSAGSFETMLKTRELERMQFLHLSLIQLVNALKFELECNRKELRMAKLRLESSNTDKTGDSVQRMKRLLRYNDQT